jgi:hypothetical protein
MFWKERVKQNHTQSKYKRIVMTSICNFEKNLPYIYACCEHKSVNLAENFEPRKCLVKVMKPASLVDDTNTRALVQLFNNFHSMAQQPLVDQGLLITEPSRSHTHTHTFGRIPLDEWSARCIDLYLTTHNTHCMKPAGFEPTIPASNWPHTHALDRAAIGIGI